MSIRVLALVVAAGMLGSAAAPPQAAQDSRPYIVVNKTTFLTIVKITMIGSGVITGENERGKLVLRLKKPVTVWKGREYSSVNVLGQGDTIEVRGVIEPDGTLVPTSIISNIARVVGTVQHVVGRSVTVSETAQGVPVDTLVHLV